MKSFKNIPFSNSLLENSVSPVDAPNILALFLLLYSQYSIHHTLLPRNADPNNASLSQEILVVVTLMFGNFTALPMRLYSMMVNILYVCVYDLYSPIPSISSLLLNYISVSTNPCNELVCLPSTHDIDQKKYL